MNTMEIDESHLNQPSTSHEIVRSEESESSSTLTLSQATNFGSDLEYVPQIPTTRAKINILTPELISALDRANVSSRNAMFIIAPVLSSVGVNVEDTTLSYRTIQRTRMLLRKDIRDSHARNLLNPYFPFEEGVDFCVGVYEEIVLDYL
ncbi:uncharacterized protein LOC141526869 [Cotesia typhae]|uniref:uncharacterized protein LOC141526869 n=1 Tax=Cotesia typhae TaxID=2053667 RepID=UPI003D691910